MGSGVGAATPNENPADSEQGDARRGPTAGTDDSDGSTGADDPAVDRPGAPGAQTCPLPTTFTWTSGPPLAQPKNGWVSLKDFTHVFHNEKHVVYMTTHDGRNWGSAMFAFDDWTQAGSAPQTKTSFGVAPTLFYFSPKDVWVLAYQWGRYKFSYRTGSDPLDPNSWGPEQSLYSTNLSGSPTGPIDQTVLCNSTRCYLFFAGDNGHIYRSSMPVEDFPGEFPAAQDSGIQGTTQNLFEGVQVYSMKGSESYLMLVEAQGAGRYYRAWTATDLEGPWSLLTDDFANSSNVTFSESWTRDISHGDLIRSGSDETFPIDPCHLQMLFQGRDPNINVSYGMLPYRPGLLTLSER